MIKWEHSIFALPFALSGAMLAAGGWPTRWQILWIVVCMVSARSAAMAFNRLADVDIDAANPRTKMRALPANLLSPSFVSVFILVSCAAFYVVRLDNLGYLFMSIFDFARWPLQVFRGAWRLFFTFVIPLGVMTTYPAMALLGRLEGRTAAFAVGVALAFLVLSRLTWLRSIRAYTSASS